MDKNHVVEAGGVYFATIQTLPTLGNMVEPWIIGYTTYTALHYTVIHYTALHYTALHNTALHCYTLHTNSIYCITQNCSARDSTKVPKIRIFSTSQEFIHKVLVLGFRMTLDALIRSI